MKPSLTINPSYYLCKTPPKCVRDCVCLKILMLLQKLKSMNIS